MIRIQIIRQFNEKSCLQLLQKGVYYPQGDAGLCAKRRKNMKG